MTYYWVTHTMGKTSTQRHFHCCAGGMSTSARWPEKVADVSKCSLVQELSWRGWWVSKGVIPSIFSWGEVLRVPDMVWFSEAPVRVSMARSAIRSELVIYFSIFFECFLDFQPSTMRQASPLSIRGISAHPALHTHRHSWIFFPWCHLL